MSTAIIGVGNIGRTLAALLVAGGETVVLAATQPPETLAKELGDLASAASTAEAIDACDVVILAVWFDVMRTLIEQHQSRLVGKVIVDPCNPIAVDEQGRFSRILPDTVSAASVIAGSLPPGTHYVKAFPTLGAELLQSSANRAPERAVVLYATDDEQAESAVGKLITAAGFIPLRAGGLAAAIRLEAFGDLSAQVLDLDAAKAAVDNPDQVNVPGA
jgi:predicted dinucleotide-binding enzyme